jgi:hypothetical protein
MSFALSTAEEDRDVHEDVELTTTEVANLIGADRSAVYEWATSGRVPFRYDDRHYVRISASELPRLRELHPTSNSCPTCHLLSRLLLQWGDTPVAELAGLVDDGDAASHLVDLEGQGFAEQLPDDVWRLTPVGVRYASLPNARQVDQLPHAEEYLLLARIIAERGPISAAAASQGTCLGESQALRRARRLERARLLYRPSPRQWAITPKGREWLAKHSPADPELPATATST